MSGMGTRTVPAPVSLLPLSLVIVPPFLQHPMPPTLSVAALLSSCLESIDLAGPSLTCGHGFLLLPLPFILASIKVQDIGM